MPDYVTDFKTCCDFLCQWYEAILQVQHLICLLHTDWHVLFLFPLFLLLSLSNEVSTLIMFFLVALVVLTWCVTPHCLSLRGYFRFTTAVNLPQQRKCVWMCVDMCRNDFVSIYLAFYVLIKQGRYAVFACTMPVRQSCPGLVGPRCCCNVSNLNT